jgi:hypothetical protein
MPIRGNTIRRLHLALGADHLDYVVVIYFDITDWFGKLE